MKRSIILFLIILIPSHLISAPVGSGFNYQGELNDGNAPANGNYDILFKAFSVESGGTEYDIKPEFLATPVANGLFHISNVDFGDALYDGSEYWIEVSVKLSGTQTYIALSPRQRINATPYAVQADFLAPNGANSGDVLQFDGTGWMGQTLNIEQSPWESSGDKLIYDEGYVGIGIEPLTALHVKNSDPIPAVFDGGDNMYMVLSENGNERGYIGSYQSRLNTSNEDFEIGTFGGSIGSLHVVTGANDPRVTVTADGKVGINNLLPKADLHVTGNTMIGSFDSQSNADLEINSTQVGTTADPLRVRKNGAIKFYVDSNGGASVGSWTTPPVDGLSVKGDAVIVGETMFESDMKQSVSSMGIAKYMVEARCAYTNSSITQVYSSTVLEDLVTITSIQGNTNNGTCTLKFPIDINPAT